MKKQLSETDDSQGSSDTKPKNKAVDDSSSLKKVEVGGPKGPEPTRYGDWEKAGRCSDF